MFVDDLGPIGKLKYDDEDHGSFGNYMVFVIDVPSFFASLIASSFIHHLHVYFQADLTEYKSLNYDLFSFELSDSIVTRKLHDWWWERPLQLKISVD